MKLKLKFLKTKKDFRKKTSVINPYIYWNFVLYITFVLIMASFIFGFLLFIKTNRESPVQAVDTSGQIGIVKKERINKVLKYFSERKQKATEILNSPSPVVDPSL
jgi:hypothetical protein